MNNKEESSIYLEGLEIVDERIKWSKHRIKFLKKCLEEEQEELEKHFKEREKIVKRLEEYGIKLEGYEMREIKFRGKAIVPVEELENDLLFIKHDNGWVYGNLIYNKGVPWIVGDIIESDPEYIVHEFWIKVYLESVGQYTGLKDENGKDIYEGDIVECFNDKNSYVSFKGGVFGLISDYGFIPFSDVHGKMRVIGNIYENPELLDDSE